ncbi:hypothetical protein CFII64_25735 [Pseudomonas sp. CFII64]|jgi:metal-responsive CopG/Arc/MetJ family transcriptional regulator|nr:hypothetical protein CFII64_25735 [Pseudomonas sp. CFII64]
MYRPLCGQASLQRNFRRFGRSEFIREAIHLFLQDQRLANKSTLIKQHTTI